ncbi:uncharacterized protein LOC126325803 [Schistocerca gregaria]|uniref:uncharacterized protein LOC126325803 n=1 Tax=Schistocerca gregaria TaxID=7010 RepID=UPI00211DCC5B|nr:uncharacterized protein LOC126325803 [Schistocerca gregaria]
MIARLANSSETVINSCEPSAKGQLLFDLLIKYINKTHCVRLDDENIKRCWHSIELSAPFVLTKELQKNSVFSHYVEKGLYYHHHNWCSILNYTKLLTIQYGATHRNLYYFSATCIQILKQVSIIQLAISEFTPLSYYQLVCMANINNVKIPLSLNWNYSQQQSLHPVDVNASQPKHSGNLSFHHPMPPALNSPYLSTSKVDQAFLQAIGQQVTVMSKTINTSNVSPPPLYNLINLMCDVLQSEEKLTHHQIFNAIKDLFYQYRLISNPFTNSTLPPKYPPENFFNFYSECAKLYLPPNAQPSFDSFLSRLSNTQPLHLSHGIIPLKKSAPVLSAVHKVIYRFILRSFLSAFMPDATYDTIDVHFENQGRLLSASATICTNPGWTITSSILSLNQVVVKPIKKNQNHPYLTPLDFEQHSVPHETQKLYFDNLNALRVGQLVCVDSPLLFHRPLQPPQHHTAASLLKHLQTMFVDNIPDNYAYCTYEWVTVIQRMTIRKLISGQNAIILPLRGLIMLKLTLKIPVFQEPFVNSVDGYHRFQRLILQDLQKRIALSPYAIFVIAIDCLNVHISPSFKEKHEDSTLSDLVCPNCHLSRTIQRINTFMFCTSLLCNVVVPQFILGHQLTIQDLKDILNFKPVKIVSPLLSDSPTFKLDPSTYIIYRFVEPGKPLIPCHKLDISIPDPLNRSYKKLMESKYFRRYISYEL